MKEETIMPSEAPERYELYETPRYEFNLTRRTFLQAIGAGIVITATSSTWGAGNGAQPVRGSVAARLHIGEDGMVTVLTGKVEVGQGSRTQLTLAAAEELRLPIERVALLMADTDLAPNDGGTFGSRTTPFTVPAVRQTAAAAREFLLDGAAEKWKAPRNELEVVDGEVIWRRGGKRIGYGELAQEAGVASVFREKGRVTATVTAPEAWQTLGTPTPRALGEAIATGRHKYPSDYLSAETLHGKILRPPSLHATLVKVDLAEAEAMKGVTVVRDGAFVGCAAPTSYDAEKAVEAIARSAEWERPIEVSSTELFEHLRNSARAESERKPRARTRGSVADGFAGSSKILKASFNAAYVQHAPMEPRAATAVWEKGRITVWTGTQRPTGVRQELAKAFGIPRDKVRVIVPDTGGGFGGKHTGDAAVEAARLALAAQKPVSVRWTREEEFTWAYFRPAGVLEASAGLDESGRIVAWDFTNINSGGSALDTPYAIANVRTQFIPCDSPLREGSYRGLASTANTFAREVFMDELAEVAGEDALAFRLAHLEDERLRAVLSAAADAFKWDGATHTGMACGVEKGGYAAACVEVAIRRNRIEVRRVVQAFECGAIQNPLNLEAQVKGCIIMGLGGALTEAIEFKEGVIQNASFKKYNVPKFKDAPPIDVILLDRKDLPSAGAGETPIIAIAPAIANAVYRATGQRLRDLPLRLEERA